MAEVSIPGAKKLMEIIAEFCDISGEGVNYNKSNIYFTLVSK